MVFIGLLVMVYLAGLGFGAELALNNGAATGIGLGFGLLSMLFIFAGVFCLSKWEMDEHP
jgi:hypothetical protein